MAEENTAEKLLETRPRGDMVAVLRPLWWTELAVGKNGSLVQSSAQLHGVVWRIVCGVEWSGRARRFVCSVCAPFAS